MGQTVISAPVVQTGQYYPYDPVKNPLGQKSWTQYFKSSFTQSSGTVGGLPSRIVYANGIYAFITTNGLVFYSSDAKNWNYQYIGSTNMMGIAYGNSIWIAYGYAGVLYSGTPGGTWTARTSQFGSGNSQIWDGKWVPTVSLFVICGYPNSSGTCCVATSPDGINWTNRLNDANSQAYYGAIDYDPNTTTIAVTCSNTTNNLYYSTNGTSWSVVNVGNQANWQLQYIKGAFNRWVTGGNFCRSSTSANIGSNWYQQSTVNYIRNVNNNSTYSSNFGANPQRTYELQYDSVNNYYYQFAPDYLNSGDFRNGVTTLITYDASTVLNTYFNSSTDYYLSMPIVKTETLPPSNLANGISGPSNNAAYGYVNSVHILVTWNVGNDGSFQIYTTA